MIGLSRTTGSELRGLMARPREAVSASAVVGQVTWPSGKPLVRLEGDIPDAHITDTTRRHAVELWVHPGTANERRWCHFEYQGNAGNGPLQPMLQCPAPSAGTLCEVRVVPLIGTPELGVTVRAI